MTALSVSIGADTTDLNTKLALAQSSMRSFKSEVRSLADQMQAAGEEAQASLLPQLEAAAAGAAAAKAEVAGLKTELAEAAPAAEHAGGAFVTMREGVEGLNARIVETKSLFSGLGELFLVGLGAEKFIGLAEGAADFGDKLQKASEETGISVENLSALNVAADHADVAFDTLQRGLSKFATAIQQGVEGTGQQAKAFQALGISQTELKDYGNDTAATMELVAQRLDQYGAGANKEAIVTALFGQRLRDMQPILADLAENGMEGLREKADEVGQLFNGEFAEAMKKAHDNSKNFEEASKSLGIELGTHLLPAVTAVEEFLANIMGSKAGNANQLTEYRDRAKELTAQIEEMKAKMAGESPFARWFDAGHLAGMEQDLTKIQANIQGLIPVAKEAGEALKLTDGKPDAPAIGNIEAETKAKQQAYNKSIELMQAETEKFSAYSAQRVAILQKEEDLAVQTWGAGSSQAIEIQGKINAAQREAATEGANALQKMIDKQNELNAASMRMGNTFRAEISSNIVETQKFDEHIDELANDISTKLAASTRKLNQDIQELAAQSDKTWTDMGNHMQSSFNSSIVGMITKGTTFSAAMQKVAQTMVSDFLSAELKTQENHVISWLDQLTTTQTTTTAQTAAVAAGAQAQVAAKAAAAAQGKAADAALGSASVMGDANKAAAGAYAAVVDIPVVGPVLAPIAAGVAFTAVAAYDVFSAEGGMASVPYDNAMILGHRNEMMLPASIANPLRQSLDDGSFGGGGATYHDNTTTIINLNGGGGAAMLNQIKTAVGSMHKSQVQRIAQTLTNAA